MDAHLARKEVSNVVDVVGVANVSASLLVHEGAHIEAAQANKTALVLYRVGGVDDLMLLCVIHDQVPAGLQSWNGVAMPVLIPKLFSFGIHLNLL